MAKRLTLRERLDNYKTINPETGCHEWSRAINRNGYGMIKYNGKMRQVHRVAYIEYTGEDIEGLCLLHSCDNPACYNIEHLTPGTHTDNMRDCFNKGRGFIPDRWGRGGRYQKDSK